MRKTVAARVISTLTSISAGSGIIREGNPWGMCPTTFTPREVILVTVMSTIDPKTRKRVLGSFGNFLVAKYRKMIPPTPMARDGKLV
jgi:hypothetical protein